MADNFIGKGSYALYLKGKISWVKYITPDELYSKWSVTLHPDTESLEKIRELQAEGVKNQLKKDDDGYFINFSRATTRKARGKLIPLAPPVVVDNEDKPIENVPIGNGSDGIVKLEIYEHPTPSGKRAKAARWTSLKVVNLVPFERDRDFDALKKEQTEGLSTQEMLF